MPRPGDAGASRALFGLQGKRILAPGGGRGIGEATVRLLAAFGCHVAVADMARYVTVQTLAVDGGYLAQYPIDLKPPEQGQSTMGIDA
jgi:NAD(P)-dependent dehydrogenase (short-subunit alcohol dehydrogenase family)